MLSASGSESPSPGQIPAIDKRIGGRDHAGTTYASTGDQRKECAACADHGVLDAADEVLDLSSSLHDDAHGSSNPFLLDCKH